MSRFRLKMARQEGEKIAKDYGFEELPVDPFAIAEALEIMVEAKPPDKKGVSGGIIFHDDNVGIFYATDIESHGYQRFTIGHELGHYFLPGHPEEILKTAPIHISRAGFSQGDSSIEIEADHFSSGLLMPTHLVKNVLSDARIGLEGIEALAVRAECSLTAAAIRSAECSQYPVAVVVSRRDEICYGFLSNGFKSLGQIKFPRKGDPLPDSATRVFNQDQDNVLFGKRSCAATTLDEWFDGASSVELDEEIVGLGNYGLTLSVFSSEALPDDEELDEEDEDQILEASYTPRFAYGR